MDPRSDDLVTTLYARLTVLEYKARKLVEQLDAADAQTEPLRERLCKVHDHAAVALDLVCELADVRLARPAPINRPARAAVTYI